MKMIREMNFTLKAMIATQGPVAADTPGSLFSKISTDVKGWLLAGIGAYAAVQFILGCIDFMSKEPQKHSAGKDHMLHACMGLVGAFAASTVMTYLETKTNSWTALIQNIPLMLSYLDGLRID